MPDNTLQPRAASAQPIADSVIDAGARAIYENWANYPACDVSKPWEFICTEREPQANDFRRKAKACIDAALAAIRAGDA